MSTARRSDRSELSALAGLASLAVLSLPRPVAAQDGGRDTSAVASDAGASEAPGSRTATLSWVRLPGAEGCPTTQDVARAVEEMLGTTVFVSAADAELAVEGRIEPIAMGFRATLRVAEASGAVLGERVIDHEGAECPAVLPTLALAIALTIDPDAEPPPPEPDPVVEPPPPVAPAPPPPRWRFDVTASALGALGLSPTATIGGGLVLALSPPGFVPLFVRGALFPWSPASISGGANVDVLQTYVGLGICPLAWRETLPVVLLACGGIDVGAVVATGARETLSEPERITVQAEVSFGVQVTIAAPLYFAADVGLVVPFRQDPFRLAAAPQPTWWRPEPVAGVLSLGLGLDVEL